MRLAALALLAACGGSPPQPETVVARATPPDAADPAVAEQQHKDELAAAHREKLDEQSTALAATCESKEVPEPRCLPSCYAPEPADPRATSKLRGGVETVHVVCGDDGGPYAIAGELAQDIRPARGPRPKPAKPKTWQADVEAAVVTALGPEVARGDAVRVIGGWRMLAHPISKQRLRCATVVHYTMLKKPLDACGSHGAIACEASRHAAAHGINVVHYRLFEARRLQAEHKPEPCQQAALEAIAVARGMPRWRQYMELNTKLWKPYARYRTRFDGVLDEDALFAAAIALGTEAEAVYAACGGASPKTTAAQEQSFHVCW